MILDSITFVFWFLPIFLIIYSLAKLKLRKTLIILASLLICAWGSSQSLMFLLFFAFMNYVFGLMIADHRNSMPLAIVSDVAFLCLFKYFGVTATLPVGISYYTLSGISYCIDIYRGDAKASKNPANTLLYLAFFPKLIMGPFIKYKDFEEQIEWPSTNSDNVANGMLRFSVGFAKKLAIAGSMADIATKCWEDAPFSTASAWLGLLAFSLQLYYDFSGYSDMALGLASIMGFELPENFRYPYESASVREFWSRWHISLSDWFKDYIYFPLGGNRKGETRTYFNLFVVWLVTGLWHGNSLSLIWWGLYMFVFIYLEKTTQYQKYLPKVVNMVSTTLIILFGWVFFHSETSIDALNYIGYLIGQAKAPTDAISTMYFDSNFPLLIIACLGCTSFPKTCAKLIFDEDSMITVIVKCIFIVGCIALATKCLVVNGYTPFIYQSF